MQSLIVNVKVALFGDKPSGYFGLDSMGFSPSSHQSGALFPWLLR